MGLFVPFSCYLWSDRIPLLSVVVDWWFVFKIVFLSHLYPIFVLKTFAKIIIHNLDISKKILYLYGNSKHNIRFADHRILPWEVLCLSQVIPLFTNRGSSIYYCSWKLTISITAILSYSRCSGWNSVMSERNLDLTH